MTRRLSNLFGVMLFLLFIGGTMILSAYHRAHCADNDATHEATTCAICQFANTSVIVTVADIALKAESTASDTTVLQVWAIPSPSWRDPSQARAPPVC